MFFTVLKKEAKHLLNDKGFLLIAILEPIVFIVMFGSSFSGGDINHLDTIVIDKDGTEFSRYVIDAVNNSEFFDIVENSDSLYNSLYRLNRSEVRAVVYVPPGFKSNIDDSIAGNLKIYIDSSNFLTYSSLSGAKVEIIKDSLQNITEDILEELENEKEEGKERIEGIRRIVDEIEIKADELEIDLENMQEDLNESSVADVEEMFDDIRDSINSQKNSISEMGQIFDDVENFIIDIPVLNQSQENDIIIQISSIRNDLNRSRRRLEIVVEDLDEFQIPNLDEDADDLNQKFESIRDLFEDVRDKTNEVNFDFEKLEKKFLSEPLIMEEIAIHGPIKYFDYLGAGVLSLIVFFVCIMAPSLNIITEKEKNTLYRISTTPASNFTLFIGKFFVFLIFGIIIMIYTLILSILLYDLRITGSVFSVLFILFLLACSSIALGLFISSKVRTMQQALIVVPLIVIPSFMISHAFFPPDIMAGFMNYVAYATPMTFSNHALNAIMVKGFSVFDVWVDVLALVAYTIVPLGLFIWGYKRVRY